MISKTHITSTFTDCFQVSASLYMVLPFGDVHHHNLEPLMCHLIISCVRFGLSLAIATLVLSILLQDLRVSITLLSIHSRSLLTSARRSKCALISDLFSECAQSAYTALGYNNLFGGKHLKCYTVDDELCAAFIRDARSDPHLNKHLDNDIYCISTV